MTSDCIWCAGSGKLETFTEAGEVDEWTSCVCVLTDVIKMAHQDAEHWQEAAESAHRGRAAAQKVSDQTYAQAERWRAQRDALAETLAVYADPDTYFAIAFWFDRPCGGFADDFSNADDWSEDAYGREMPGKRAREAIMKFVEEEEATTP